MAIPKRHRTTYKVVSSKAMRIVHTQGASYAVLGGKAKKETSIAVSTYYSTGDSIVLGHDIGTRLSLGLPELKSAFCTE